MRQQFFRSTWLSSPAHVQHWERLFYDAAGRPRHYTSATIPSLVPHARPFWGLSAQALPSAYLATGILDIDGGRLRFAPREFRFLGNRHVGFRADLAFDLPLARLRSAGTYTLRSPVSRAFDLTFARVESDGPGVLSDFLLAVGPTGLNVFTARRQNARLLALLAGLTPGGDLARDA